jgi:predicted glycogen debranching enzyme
MTALVHRMAAPSTEAAAEELLSREWLVTNGLGGYASGTVLGVPTRRFHGILIAALPAPHGRTMMLNHLGEAVRLADGSFGAVGSEEALAGGVKILGTEHLEEFRLELGIPVWRYQIDGTAFERRLVMPHRQNTVHALYRLLSGRSAVLRLRPAMHFRPHEGQLGGLGPDPYVLRVQGPRYEVEGPRDLPRLRMTVQGAPAELVCSPRLLPELVYRIEQDRGYDARGQLWSPGYFDVELTPGSEVVFTASTERWETLLAVPPEATLDVERGRRELLLEKADPRARDGIAGQLVLAADQFLITPSGRLEDVARARAAGDEVRTVIAGYHWFTDWGRDTMISLEGLTLTTGRRTEASWILRTFAHYVRDGLIPNMFPEGENEGLYHTADATLWFFHAVDRYLQETGDRTTLHAVLPKLEEVVAAHLRGTRFGIGVDPADGLVRQGAEGYQLTWMDAKVDGWVVTPRRGKAVEINALWYNALRNMERWASEEKGDAAAAPYREHAERARESFNRRFWYEDGGHLYDVLDGEDGRNDPACRPNQVFAISLPNPVLDESRWKRVLQVVREQLYTPVGLRSLAPGHPDYKARYFGDLRTRDAAYHQGTVWGWLIGPFVDAWLRTHPGDLATAHGFLRGFLQHMDEACVGSISEIFDAEAPYTARGCCAQAWSVAEVLRCWVKTAPR